MWCHIPVRGLNLQATLIPACSAEQAWLWQAEMYNRPGFQERRTDTHLRHSGNVLLIRNIQAH
jgi:hypothetical protein